MTSGLGTSPIHFPGFEKNQLFQSCLTLGYFPNTRVVGIEMCSFESKQNKFRRSDQCLWADHPCMLRMMRLAVPYHTGVTFPNRDFVNMPSAGGQVQWDRDTIG